MGSKGSAPATPDYTQAAIGQGAINKDTMLAGLGATRVGQSNPYGSLQWNYTGPDRGAAPVWEDYLSMYTPGTVNPSTTSSGDGHKKALGGYGAHPLGDGIDMHEGEQGRYYVFEGDPYNMQFTSEAEARNAMETITGRTSTAPLVTEEEARKQFEGDLQAWNTQGMTTPGAWSADITLSPEMQAIFNTGYGAYNKAAANLTASPFDISSAFAGGDWSMLQDALANDGSKYTDAYYNSATRLLGDKYSQEEAAIRNQLLNSGVSEGSEAYNNMMTEFMDSKNKNYLDIADKSITSGAGLRSQDISSLLSALTGMDSARAGDISELSYMRNLPMSEAQTILSGLQVPNFSGGLGGASTSYQGADIMGAMGNQYNADMNAYNAEQATSQNQINSLMQMGLMAALIPGTGGGSALLGLLG